LTKYERNNFANHSINGQKKREGGERGFLEAISFVLRVLTCFINLFARLLQRIFTSSPDTLRVAKRLSTFICSIYYFREATIMPDILLVNYQ